jgi:hypothetical protein
MDQVNVFIVGSWAFHNFPFIFILPLTLRTSNEWRKSVTQKQTRPKAASVNSQLPPTKLNPI